MLLFPNPQHAVRGRGHRLDPALGCKRYEGTKTLDAIRDFRDQFRGRGPEGQVPITP